MIGGVGHLGLGFDYLYEKFVNLRKFSMMWTNFMPINSFLETIRILINWHSSISLRRNSLNFLSSCSNRSWQLSRTSRIRFPLSSDFSNCLFFIDFISSSSILSVFKLKNLTRNFSMNASLRLSTCSYRRLTSFISKNSSTSLKSLRYSHSILGIYVKSM